MKAKRLSILIIASVSCAVLDVHAVTVRGDWSCGKWMEAHQSSEMSMESITSEAWTVGYLSAVASEKGKDFLRGTDNESLFLWITNYCRAHPLDYVDAASDRLADELTRRKGL